MTDQITVQLVRSRFLTRYPCHVCDGCTEKVYWLAEAETENGTFRVCETCLKSGAGELDAALEAQAQRLEGLASLTRAMSGRLVLPSYAEWQAAMAATDAEIAAFYEAEERERPVPGATGGAYDDELDEVPF